MLGGPANWTIITFADLLFAINGGVPRYAVDYPLDRPPRNMGSREKYYDKKSGSSDSSSGGKPLVLNGL
jgi:hypothetical protein